MGFGFLGAPLGWIMWLLYSVIKNYGITLLLFTLLIKIVLFPLSIKQQKSTAKMAIFQPKIAEIQKKYANNKEKQQEELSKLYQEHGYNPLSGCLPMLATFVVLFGIIDVVYKPLTYILRFDNETITRATEILTAKLTEAGQVAGQAQLQIISYIQNPETVSWFAEMGTEFVDKIVQFDYTLFGIYMGDVPTWSFNWLLLVPILSGVTSFLVSVISMKMSPSGQEAGGMMKGMMYLMPVMSAMIAFKMPVGVGIYWIFSNLLAGVQSVVLHYMYNPEKYKQEYQRQLDEAAERKKQEREKRRQAKLLAGQPLADEDLTEDELAEKQAKKKKKKEQKESEEQAASNRDARAEYLSEKERNRRRLAEARRLDAEKYGEEYEEVTDDDLK